MSLADNRGFTLIELLMTILIVGILSAIALPALLGQREEAQDAAAKTHARNLMTLMETCWQEQGGYSGCAATLTTAATGLPIGAGQGEVRVTSETATSFVLTATSRAAGGGPHTFTISQDLGGEYRQTCLPKGRGGCGPDGTW